MGAGLEGGRSKRFSHDHSNRGIGKKTSCHYLKNLKTMNTDPEANNPEILPPAPDHLSDGEKAIFKEIAGKMLANGSLSELDLYSLETYSVQLNLFRIATKELQKPDAYIQQQTIKNGIIAPAPSPWIRILRDSNSILLSLSAKLGLNPTDRNKASKVRGKKRFETGNRFRT
jgi:P27 family predicted phage terminase small subunit